MRISNSRLKPNKCSKDYHRNVDDDYNPLHKTKNHKQMQQRVFFRNDYEYNKLH